MRDDHNGTATRMIQSIPDDLIKTVIDEVDPGDVLRVFDLKGIVDDNEVGALAGELAADGHGINAPPAVVAKSDTLA